MRNRFVAAVFVLIGLPGIALAQSNEDLKQQIQNLQRQIDALRAQVEKQQTPPAPANAPVASAPASPQGGSVIERKAGDGMVFLTRGGEVQVYANLDLSVDAATKGISRLVGPGGPTDRPFGNGGWMTDISGNLSYVGLRGHQAIGTSPTQFVWQLETQLDVSATPGTSGSNSNTSSAVKSALVSRNSFIGVASPDWGAFKIGKTDAPYKTSTSPLNPFSGMWGDYQVIMGNSGGDNRVEFGTRLAHALWYESPSWNGLSFAALVSPGQNRATDSSNQPAGEYDCAGGNIPGSGGTPVACNDGSYGTAYSASAVYRAGPLYLVGAYELHKKVNRTSDLPAFDPTDVADESAAKVGAQYRLVSTGTTVGAIYERLRRDVPGPLASQNERTRHGTWLVVSQDIGGQDSVHFGWAHAGSTPGDPGVHNTTGGASPDNAANMFTVAWKHQVDHNLSWYLDYAVTANHRDAHYDLGAGGRGVTTDCHDASNPDATGFDPAGGGPRCWAGGRLQGASVGARYAF